MMKKYVSPEFSLEKYTLNENVAADPVSVEDNFDTVFDPNFDW